MYYKKIVLIYIFLMAGFVYSLLVWTYIVDPYMLFHKNWSDEKMMSADMRIANYGLIKYEDFDGIILGTSMLENSSADEASRIFGGRFANLSMEAATYWEKYQVLNFAFNTKKINRVIMSLDLKFEKEKENNITFQSRLYSKFPFSAIFDIYTSEQALSCIFLKQSCALMKVNLDAPHAWSVYRSHMVRFGGLEKWIFYQNDEQLQDVFDFLLIQKPKDINYVAAYKKIVDEEIVPLFENKNVSFDLIIPPYFALWWAKNLENFDELMLPYRYLVEKAAYYKNVRIHWLYDENFVFDIRYYKDLTHYHPLINSLQLSMIKEGQHVINKINFDEKVLAFKSLLKRIDREYFFEVFRRNVRLIPR